MYLPGVLQGDIGFRGLPGLPGPPGEGLQGPPVLPNIHLFTDFTCLQTQMTYNSKNNVSVSANTHQGQHSYVFICAGSLV